MSQLTKFLKLAFGWKLGENGWNVEMDSNIQKIDVAVEGLEEKAHAHGNKALLDAYTYSNEQIGQAVAAAEEGDADTLGGHPASDFETPEGAQQKADAAENDAKAYANSLINDLINGAPENLNTLEELASALNDDQAFATTVLNLIAQKADLGQIPTSLPANGGNADTLGGVALNRFIFGDNSHGSIVKTSGSANDIVKSGFYTCSSSVTDLPETTQTVFILNIQHGNNDAGATQLGFIYGFNKSYIRSKNNGVWTSWVKLWNAENDGSGSGLDADLLDGKHASDFALAGFGLGSDSINIIADCNAVTAAGWYYISDTTSNRPEGWCTMIHCPGSAPTAATQITFGVLTNNIYIRGKSGGNWGSWVKCWNKNNDGTGSGLDADLIDGIDSTRIIYGDNSYGTILQAASPDTIQKSGFYRCNSGLTGLPTSDAIYYIIHVNNSNASNHAVQIAIHIYDPSKIYTRINNAGVWTSWVKLLGSGLLTASEIPNLDWSKITTGKPTTLAGYGITDGATVDHKYHKFVDGTYYFDAYDQSNYLRLFTETAASDCLRYQPIESAEYYDGSSWISWPEALNGLTNILDGNENTLAVLDRTHRNFRMVINSNYVAWPTRTLLVLQTGYAGTAGFPGVTVTFEKYNGTAWAWKETCDFTSANGFTNHGIMMKVSSGLHDGGTKVRITVSFNDFDDSGTDKTMPIKRLMVLSNYVAGNKLPPFNWDYGRNMYFNNELYVNSKKVYHAGNLSFGSGLSYNGSVLTASGDGGSVHGQQVFTANGTFTVPAGVTQVYVSMCGGGGGGGYPGYQVPGGACGGGGGESVLKYSVTVTPGESIPVTIGAGGYGSDVSDGSSGGSSSFGSYITCVGGAGGKGITSPGIGGSSGGAGKLKGGNGGYSGFIAPSSTYLLISGAGGSSVFGYGGVANAINTTSQISIAGNPGVGYGAGGSGSLKNSANGQKGGDGTPGICIVEW
jgi:hypothetical protein